jgi:hypothetical protein
MDVAFTQQGTLHITKLIETKQRVVAGAAEMPVVRRAFLLPIGFADRTIHVEDEFPHWLTFPQLLNP